MQDDSPLARAVAMVADLRARCAWDRVQTRETLRPYLIEEAHELDHAIATGDRDAIRDEVGDLMLHLAWQLVLGLESGEFTPDDIADTLVAKMRRRHPHLFDLGPRESWTTLKSRERGGAGVLGGIAPSLPALLRAFRLQERAASVGFDWPDASGPIAKVREELDEVVAEVARDGSDSALRAEVGDLLFAVVNLARKIHIDPTAALERANTKFVTRFRRMEETAAAKAIDLSTLDLTAQDQLWNEAKAREKSDQG